MYIFYIHIASESHWNLTQLDALTTEMGQEIARLNTLQSRGYAMSDEEEEDEGMGKYGMNRSRGHGPGSISSFGSFNKKYAASKPYMNKGYGGYDDHNKKDQLMSLPNHFYNPQRSQYSDRSGATTKRNSLISVNSASDFNQKYMDMHKQTLFSAAKIIENMVNEANDNNSYGYGAHRGAYSNNNGYGHHGQQPQKLDEEYRKN